MKFTNYALVLVLGMSLVACGKKTAAAEDAVAPGSSCSAEDSWFDGVYANSSSSIPEEDRPAAVDMDGAPLGEVSSYSESMVISCMVKVSSALAFLQENYQGTPYYLVSFGANAVLSEDAADAEPVVETLNVSFPDISGNTDSAKIIVFHGDDDTAVLALKIDGSIYLKMLDVQYDANLTYAELIVGLDDFLASPDEHYDDAFIVAAE